MFSSANMFSSMVSGDIRSRPHSDQSSTYDAASLNGVKMEQLPEKEHFVFILATRALKRTEAHEMYMSIICPCLILLVFFRLLRARVPVPHALKSASVVVVVVVNCKLFKSCPSASRPKATAILATKLA